MQGRSLVPHILPGAPGAAWRRPSAGPERERPVRRHHLALQVDGPPRREPHRTLRSRRRLRRAPQPRRGGPATRRHAGEELGPPEAARHAMADDLPRRLRDQVAPVVCASQGRDLLRESLVRRLRRPRGEETRPRRDRSFGRRQNGRVLDVGRSDREQRSSHAKVSTNNTSRGRDRGPDLDSP